MTWIRRVLLWLAVGERRAPARLPLRFVLASGSFVGVVSIVACATAGPSAAERLEDRRLVKRAAFDLDCPTEPMSIVRIDEKTRGVRGCGRQATYVKLCDAPVDNPMRDCTWVMNSGNRSAF